MPGINVRLLSESDSDKRLWQEYVNGHPLATFYHSLSWKFIFEKSFGYRSFYLMAQESSSPRLAGCLPLFLVASPLSKRMVSLPFRDRGGILWDEGEAFCALFEKAKQILQNSRARFMELKSLCPYPQELVNMNHLQERFYWVRSVVDLKNMSVEKLWSALSDKTRNMIRQAEKAMLSFEDITQQEHAARVWYRLHMQTQKKLGLPPFPELFFFAVIQELVKEKQIKIFLVHKEKTPVAASIFFLHRASGIYGYSASDSRERSSRSNDFMLYHCLRWLIENKYEEMDMGSDAPSQEGLLFFKRKWGAVQNPIPFYTYGKAVTALSDSSDSRYALFRMFVRRLPLSVLRAAGIFTRHFG